MYFRFVRIAIFLVFLIAYTTTKSQVLMDSIEIRALEVPREFRKSPEELTNFLIEPAKNNEEKVRAIYTWICDNISYNYRHYKKGNPGFVKPKKVLKKKKAVCLGYATLFKAMCDIAGVECYVVPGYTKFEGKIKNETMGDHAWNVVRLNGTWHLLDVTWASGYINEGFTLKKFRKLRNDQWYLVSPERFVLSHLPEDPMWQLLENPVTFKLYKRDEEKINEHLETAPHTFEFEDSIAVWRELNRFQQEYYSGLHAKRFNRNNSISFAIGTYYRAVEIMVLPEEKYLETIEGLYHIRTESEKYYQISYKNFGKVKSQNKYVLKFIDDMKDYIQDSLIQAHLQLGELDYLKAKDSIIYMSKDEIKTLEKRMLEHLKIAEKYNLRLGRKKKFEIVSANYLYHLGTILSNEALEEPDFTERKAMIKNASKYLKKSISLYKRNNSKQFGGQISEGELLLDRLAIAKKAKS